MCTRGKYWFKKKKPCRSVCAKKCTFFALKFGAAGKNAHRLTIWQEGWALCARTRPTAEQYLAEREGRGGEGKAGPPPADQTEDRGESEPDRRIFPPQGGINAFPHLKEEEGKLAEAAVKMLGG